MNPIAGLDRAALDRARLSRDRRFDGKFFIAVKTTGIYCRPVCPAPSPRQQNIHYFATAAAVAPRPRRGRLRGSVPPPWSGARCA